MDRFNTLDSGPRVDAMVISGTGEQARVSRYGQLITALGHDDILCRFEYNNSAHDITTTTTGTGSVTNASSLAVVESGTGVGAAKMFTNRTARYRPAHEIVSYLSMIFTSAEANSYQRGGIYDTIDGFFFGYSGATFGVTHRSNSADTFIPQSSWNRDRLDGSGDSKFTLDPTKNNQYSIAYGWLGIAPITFSVYCGDGLGWVVVHVIDYTNSITTSTITSPNLPVTIESGRTSGTGANLTVKVGCISAGTTEGIHAHAGHRVFAARATKSISGGVETYVATFRNKSTFQNKANKIGSEAVFLGAASDGTKSVELLFYRNATVTGANYAEVDATDSITEYDTAGSSTGGHFEMSVPLAKVDRIALDLGAGHIHLELLPGETMTVKALSAGASDIILAFRWEEYFA